MFLRGRKPDIELYSPYMTEEGLDNLFAGGLEFYMDEPAYENKFLIEVQDITLEQSIKDSEKQEYQCTMKLNFKSKEKTLFATGSGIISLELKEDGEYRVHFIIKN